MDATPGNEAPNDGSAGEEDAANDERESGTAAFKDSGSFFREQVARTLAEQGYDFRSDGTWGESDPERSGPLKEEESEEDPSQPPQSQDPSDTPSEDGEGQPEPAPHITPEQEPPSTAPDEDAATVDEGESGTSEDVPSGDDGASESVAASPDAHEAAGSGIISDDSAEAEQSEHPDPAVTPPEPEDSSHPEEEESSPTGDSDEAVPETEAAAGESDTPPEPTETGSAVTTAAHEVVDPQPNAAEQASPAAEPKRPEFAASGDSPEAAEPQATPTEENPVESTTAAPAVASDTSNSAAPAGGKPPSGKTPGKTKKPLWWRITRAGLIGVGVCLVLAIAGFGIAYATIPVPDATKEVATDQGSTFYYSDGETKFAERGVDRDPVDYEDIPPEVQEAVISAEDRGFWEEPGVSLTGTLRAIWATATGEQVQGGSTITQQMVRNYYEGVSKDRTIERKFKEIVISLKVDQSKSKKWVMEQYLNTIYFGRNAYGIQAASQAYFHKDMEDLNSSEAAFLASAIQQPSLYGNADNDFSPAMKERWESVLTGMVELDTITQSEADEMERPEPEENRPADGNDLSGYKGYMLHQAMSELEDLGYTEDNINRGGYAITTTFDKDLMEAATSAVEDSVDIDSLPDGVNVGMSAVDPETGEVRAFYGGHDYLENQYDSSTRGKAQAGSGFKPYVLAAALESGTFTLNSVVDGSDNQVFNGVPLGNAHSGGGPMTVTQATASSNNNAYANIAQQTGLQKVRDMATDIGLPESAITDQQAAVARLALGISSVRPIDQAGSYATFANDGKHVQPHVVSEITNQDGENEREDVPSNRAMSSDTAADATYAMQQVVNGGTGARARLPDGRPAAGKTGTTDNNVAAWFNGYTPQLAASVGVYNGNNQRFSVPGYGTVNGGSLPADIWRSFMAEAMQGKEVEEFPSPSDNPPSDWEPEDSGGGNEGQQTPVDPQPQNPASPAPGGQTPQNPGQQQPQQPDNPDNPENENPGRPDDPGGTGDGGGESQDPGGTGDTGSGEGDDTDSGDDTGGTEPQ
ncbi:membrane peptidoglycan carboxypeptidase [Haloactinospora alba]|uniref:Membrane peptidoglycan carboxypeptidase n=1 Tax=Haloactinospora alba TaxID=405555 RepID=A0A543NG58_9ACTN|nr:transglycosylase domain-containing protein [Haloactinospora alba]TQN30825.1 membrane peptidoglycan carboxypeptidase [Haloactinospora alba]